MEEEMQHQIKHKVTMASMLAEYERDAKEFSVYDGDSPQFYEGKLGVSKDVVKFFTPIHARLSVVVKEMYHTNACALKKSICEEHHRANVCPRCRLEAILGSPQ